MTLFVLFPLERQRNMSDKAMSNLTRTDWSRLAQQTDDDIDTSDIPPLTEAFFARAKLLIPPAMIGRTIQLDADIMQWFKSQDKDYPQSINRILRSYMETHNK